ncbi:exo-beta-N-acetylmuramidase NamZ domain-containing protein [Geojedonia litorea]|uniref:Exo-beta-N-acetylmuramidase NamZ domain-containing protein n=1 Tax=Geojedonia litorea TaxID=1268269 RepID=A0ABV9N576_9FLAO
MKYTVILFVFAWLSCNSNSKKNTSSETEVIKEVQNENLIIVGANQTDLYLSKLKGKNVGIAANQTSVIFKGNTQDDYTHLVDSLLRLNINVTKVFAPEHGFRGVADAGEHITDGIDSETGLPIISLYGENSKPSKKNLENIDVMIFDIQDVGVRFYTYLSTLHYVMEACAELNIPVLVLDRPNPNGHYIDGPLLEEEVKSFVGLHPVPIVYGMTIGEYANMINGEKWLKNGIQCDLTVVSLKNYTYHSEYDLPIKPSPNLPNATSINLYASLCFFEGTTISCGRGTETQFQVFGAPFLPEQSFDYSFTPQPNFGSKTPKHQGQLCFGRDLTNAEKLSEINLSWLIEAYKSSPQKEQFFNKSFTRLAGTKTLQQQIENGLTVQEIKKSWQPGLESFKKVREKYLLYN